MGRPHAGAPAYRRAIRVLATSAAAGLTGCSSVVLDPKGPVGTAETMILYNALAIMLVIVVPTILATLVVAWWFRASNTRATYRPEWVFSGRIELVVWSIPLMTILLLSGVIWSGSHALDPAQPLRSTVKPLEVEVVSLDWKWLFIYPAQGVAAVNDLVVPAGTPVHFRLTSASVMSVFFVPQLGSMIYTMNGMRDPPQPRRPIAWATYRRAGRRTINGEGFSGDALQACHAVSPNAVWRVDCCDGAEAGPRCSTASRYRATGAAERRLPRPVASTRSVDAGFVRCRRPPVGAAIAGSGAEKAPGMMRMVPARRTP